MATSKIDENGTLSTTETKENCANVGQTMKLEEGEGGNETAKNEDAAKDNAKEDKGSKETESTNVTPKEEQPKEEKKEDEKKPEVIGERQIRDNLIKLGFRHANIPLLYEVMQVPSHSSKEYRMATFIILWARKNGIDCRLDAKGNIYLTKGKPVEGEFYPCVTSHMDTVQDKADPYILAGAELPLQTSVLQSQTDKTVFKHKVFIDGQGIGADDKLGVYISLCLMEKTDVIKAAFFVEEEIGMKGSEKLDPEFFKDVAFVVGWDSPDLIRAAWKCSGTRLFSREFYEEHLGPITKRWGFKDSSFRSEPFTDVIHIVEKTGIVCCNFGNGGYLAHSQTEYLIIEDVDHAVGMGEDIIKSIGGKKQFKIEKKQSYAYSADGPKGENDDAYFNKIFGYANYGHITTYHSNGTVTYNSGGTQSRSTASSGTTSGGSTSNSTTTSTGSTAIGYSEEVLSHIVESYDAYIKEIKTKVGDKCDALETLLKEKLAAAGIDYDETIGYELKNEVIDIFSTEIKF